MSRELPRIERVRWKINRLGDLSEPDPHPLRILTKRTGEPVRRIVRIMLVGDPVASAKASLAAAAESLREREQQDPKQLAYFAGLLERIGAGEDPARVLGLKRPASEPRDPDRVTMIALDYFLRSCVRPKARKIAESVAHDWDERSVETVKQIWRRTKPLAQEIALAFLRSEMKRKDFDPNESGRLYLEAVAAARQEILTGKPCPIVKSPEETIELTWDLYHVLRFDAQCE